MVYTKVPNHSDTNNKKNIKKNTSDVYFSMLYSNKQILSQNNEKDESYASQAEGRGFESLFPLLRKAVLYCLFY